MVALLRAKRSNSSNSEEFGWRLTDDELKPLWFNGDQFPPSITGRRQGKQGDSNDADNESSTQMNVLLKINFERNHLLFSQRK